MNEIIVFYDISNNKYRNKLVKLLDGYGKRIQKSVFQLNLSNSKYNEFESKIARLRIDKVNDSIIIIKTTSLKKKIFGNFNFNIDISDNLII